MNPLRRLFRLTQRKSASSGRPTNRVRLNVEGLETRLVPASVFVVPVALPEDSTHVHVLGKAIAAAGAGGLVTIEPGTIPDNFTFVGAAGITIQGDPNVPGSILAPYNLEVGASNVTLTNLNLGSLTLDAPFSGNNVSKCLIGTLSEHGHASTFTQNTITVSASFTGSGVTGGDLIANNTFDSNNLPTLLINSSPGTMVTQNTFVATTNLDAILLANSVPGASFLNTISNNDITILTPSSQQFARGITVNGKAGTVKILNNRINTNSLSIGVEVDGAAGLSVLLQGNDLHGNLNGVSITGDGISAGTIDLGGGSLGSRGGNNFRSFVNKATATSAAIRLDQAPETTVSAQQNLFANGVDPSSVVSATSGAIDVTQPLSSGRAFVQALYNEVLSRTGALAELDPWVNLLNTQGQAAVANGIRLSSEALGRLVDQSYLRFLGRQSDTAGRAGWIAFLQQGGTWEALENAFLTAPEYINHINTDYVQSLYLNLFGRTGSAAELASWNNNLQSLGLAGIANAFTHSSENRLNTLRSYFQTFLHRTPADAELTPLANSSLSLLDLEGAVLSSAEFFANG